MQKKKMQKKTWGFPKTLFSKGELFVLSIFVLLTVYLPTQTRKKTNPAHKNYLYIVCPLCGRLNSRKAQLCFTTHSNRRCSGRLHSSANPPAADPQQTHGPSVRQKNPCWYSGDPWTGLWQRPEWPCRLPCEDRGAWGKEENPCFCAALWCSPVTGRGCVTGQLLHALQAMSCLTNLSSWRGLLLNKIFRRHFCDFPKARSWKAKRCTVSGWQTGQEKKTELRTERAK